MKTRGNSRIKKTELRKSGILQTGTPPSPTFFLVLLTLLPSFTPMTPQCTVSPSASQANSLRRIPGVLSIVPDQIRYLHTTRTPHFLRLADNYGLWPNSDYAEDVIIGVLDTGIWPELRTFADFGLSVVPVGWKGICETSHDFPASTCNRKIIGARALYKGYEAYLERPIDESVESKSPRYVVCLEKFCKVEFPSTGTDSATMKIVAVCNPQQQQDVMIYVVYPTPSPSHRTCTGTTFFSCNLLLLSLILMAKLDFYDLCWPSRCWFCKGRFNYRKRTLTFM